ncbi:MAG: hypothetical protein V3R57_03985 [Candidatus Bathyarchaeia archaeon]
MTPWLGKQIMEYISTEKLTYIGAGQFAIYATFYYFLLRTVKEIQTAN